MTSVKLDAAVPGMPDLPVHATMNPMVRSAPNQPRHTVTG
jgi:hypothetical protein